MPPHPIGGAPCQVHHLQYKLCRPPDQIIVDTRCISMELECKNTMQLFRNMTVQIRSSKESLCKFRAQIIIKGKWKKWKIRKIVERESMVRNNDVRKRIKSKWAAKIKDEKWKRRWYDFNQNISRTWKNKKDRERRVDDIKEQKLIKIMIGEMIKIPVPTWSLGGFQSEFELYQHQMHWTTHP